VTTSKEVGTDSCAACEHDLEGIVAKQKLDPYSSESSGWLKIQNCEYSQWINREELFERERETEPNFDHWNDCMLACESLDAGESSQAFHYP
jgi:hypothetical protein